MRTLIVANRGQLSGQRMGYLKQSVDAPKQTAHTDEDYYSAMLSRHDSTHLYFYVVVDEVLVEFDIYIPAGFIIFWAGDVEHAGGEYRKEVPGGSERIFAYVHGWSEGYSVAEAQLSRHQMCAQQGVNAALYEDCTSERSPQVRLKKRKHEL